MLISDQNLKRVLELALQIFHNPVELQKFIGLLHVSLIRHQEGMELTEETKETLESFNSGGFNMERQHKYQELVQIIFK